MSNVIGAFQPSHATTYDFEDWAEVFQQFLLANKLDVTKAEDQCRGILCFSLSLPTFTLLKDLVSPKMRSEAPFDDFIQTLKKHFKPARKALSGRFRFGKRVQGNGESKASYVSSQPHVCSIVVWRSASVISLLGIVHLLNLDIHRTHSIPYRNSNLRA